MQPQSSEVQLGSTVPWAGLGVGGIFCRGAAGGSAFARRQQGRQHSQPWVCYVPRLYDLQMGGLWCTWTAGILCDSGLTPQ